MLIIMHPIVYSEDKVMVVVSCLSRKSSLSSRKVTVVLTITIIHQMNSKNHLRKNYIFGYFDLGRFVRKIPYVNQGTTK